MKKIKQKDKTTITIGDIVYLDLHTRSTVIAFCDDQELGVKLVITRYWSKHKARYYYETLPLPSFIYDACLWSECKKEWANKICDSFGINHLF